ncbi:xanthine dehydrogenase family protein molybdopterin-binding subunit [Ahrensia sp. R2A130]|uniref:xanthine dehydrogenase family protein molybdopterin-binding subunit n=1 Tax=Ahrensia sp. R2A130 TaxID=744979 RepID=UPI0001E0D8CA|nr:xanthine dehydrogenase family protein molybdopterin-binding subunit [Ahrensia sp. R2A130]EFL87536.1 aldehyde oxidase and xanthine dehydrogenase molybdopterin binding [Ahrensia sp. R2A130]
MVQDSTYSNFGKPLPRDGDDRLVQGQGCYAGDMAADGALWMHVVRSDHAAGRIAGLDVDAAREAPGVAAVLTGADQGDLQAFALRYVPKGSEVVPTPYLPMVQDHVKWVGEPVAVVIAETRRAAMDAAELVWLDVEETEPVTDARRAADADAPLVWSDRPDNTAFFQELGDRMAYEAAQKAASNVITARIDISRVTAVTLEPRNALAVPESDGRTVLHTGTQAPHRVQAEAAHVLGIEPADIIVRTEQTGGSFGMRNGAYPEDVLVLMASRLLNRPVRWGATRSEAFLCDAQSREMSVDVTLALDKDNRFLALGIDGFAPIGAHHGPMAMHPMTSNLAGLAGVYRTPLIHTRLRGMHVNSMHMAPYRGAGRPEAIYLIERIIDIAARQLNIDPVELRRRNMITPDQMPHATPLGYVYDSGDFPAALDKALEASDWGSFDARSEQSASRGMLRGIGLACAIEPAGGGPAGAQLPEFARITVDPQDGLTLDVGSGDAGQGHSTAFRQIAERLLGWTDCVAVRTGDTGEIPNGLGTFGSRTMGAAGHALADSARQIIALALPDAAEHLEVSVADVAFENGRFEVVGTDRAINLHDLSSATGNSYEAEAFVPTDAGTFPNGAHVCEVEIDPETGTLTLESYLVVDDVGTIINPLLMEGQVHGGVAQGVGQALHERVVFDPDTGAMLSGSLMDYTMPRAADLPMMTVLHSPTATSANALGAKGVGESGTVGALPATINAVCDALARAGAGPIDMPATPARIWAALRERDTP